MGSALKTYLDLLFLQQAVSPDDNSNGPFHLTKKVIPSNLYQIKNPVLYITLTKYFIGWKELPQRNFFLILFCNFHYKVQYGCYILRVGESKAKQEPKKASHSSQLIVFLYREKRFPVTLLPGAPAWLKSILLLGGSLCACSIEWKECRGKMRTQIHVLAATRSMQ